MGILDTLYLNSPIWLQNRMVALQGSRLWKRRYGAGFSDVVSELRRLDTLPPEETKPDIERRLRTTVEHAAKFSPYYRNVFRESRIDPRSIDCLEALADIPILEKEVLRTRPEEFVTTSSKEDRYAVQTTSGSTGTPVNVVVDKFTYQLAMGLLVHHEERYGVKLGDRRATFAGRMIQRANKRTAPFWRFNPSENQMLYSSYHLSELTVESYVNSLNNFRPREIIGYPSAIASIASLIRSEGMKIRFSPKLIVTNSETLLAQQREIIESVFDAPVHDYYGTAEYLVFAWNTEPGTYQVHPALGVVETVDAHGTNVFEEPGDLLCTTLCNRTMPLLRYRVGDVGILTRPDQRDRYGGQVLRGIEGRMDDIVVTRDGRRVGRLDHVFKGMSGIRECQIVQHGIGDFELVLVPTVNNSELDEVVATIRKNLEGRIGGSVSLRLTKVDRVPRGSNGKFRGVVSHVRRPSTGS